MTPTDLAPFLTGTVSGLVISLIGNWYQAKEKKDFQASIKAKDDDLKGLTREAIASVTTLATLNQSNQKWQQDTSDKLESIRKALP